MSNAPVVSVTDELIAELDEACREHRLGFMIEASEMRALLAEREELKRDAKRLSELAEQANVNCKNTAYYLRKYRPDLADICSGWCTAIDAAMKS